MVSINNLSPRKEWTLTEIADDTMLEGELDVLRVELPFTRTSTEWKKGLKGATKFNKLKSSGDISCPMQHCGQGVRN